MANESFFLVRHGRYNMDGLTPEGVVDAHKAGDTLLAKGLGGRVLVLSSSAVRALQTAEVVAEKLQANVVPSERINEGGNLAGAVRDLDEWVERALIEAGQAFPTEQQLIVVAHAPLIAVAKGHSVNATDRVGYGEVYEYQVGSWVNPEFSEVWAEMAEENIPRS